MDNYVRPVVIHPRGELALITSDIKDDVKNSDRCFKYCLSIFGFNVCFYRNDYIPYYQEEDFDLVSFFMVIE